MATNKLPMNIVVRQNENDDSPGYGKWYGEILLAGTLSTRAIAKHMVEHGSTFNLSTIIGVLTALSQCVPELLSEGIGVKVSGLGTWYPSLSTQGADYPSQFSISKFVKGVHIRFLPDSSDLDNVTSKEFRKMCQLSVFGTVKSVVENGKRRKKVVSYVDPQKPEDPPMPNP